MKHKTRYYILDWILPIAILSGVTACFYLFFMIVNWYMDGTSETEYKPNFLATPASSTPLAESEAAARVEALLETNGDCRLPCWWGIVPGVTTWRKAHALLTRMMKPIDVVLIGDKKDNEIYFRGSYSFKDQLWVSIEATDQTVHAIMVDLNEKYLPNWKLSRLLQSYGMPEEIYLRAYNYSPDVPVQIFLYYPSQGIAVEYLYYVRPVDQALRLCDLEHPASGEVYTGEPSSFTDFSSIAESALWHPKADAIFPLMEAVGWSNKLFYETFKVSASEQDCIETPVSLWLQNQ